MEIFHQPPSGYMLSGPPPYFCMALLKPTYIKGGNTTAWAGIIYIGNPIVTSGLRTHGLQCPFSQTDIHRCSLSLTPVLCGLSSSCETKQTFLTDIWPFIWLGERKQSVFNFHRESKKYRASGPINLRPYLFHETRSLKQIEGGWRYIAWKLNIEVHSAEQSLKRWLSAHKQVYP